MRLRSSDEKSVTMKRREKLIPETGCFDPSRDAPDTVTRCTRTELRAGCRRVRQAGVAEKPMRGGIILYILSEGQ